MPNFQIASPCSADWNKMSGGDRMRYCPDCKLNVYNFSAMTPDEIEKIVQERTGRLCARFYQRTDGTLLTQDCPIGFRGAVLRASKLVAAALTAVLIVSPSRAGATQTLSNSSLLQIQPAADSLTLQVIDPTGAAISGAAVLIVNEKTGKQTHYAAGTDGKLHLADIAPGIYEVSVHASGFAWHKVSHLELPSHEVITLRLDLPALMGEVVSVMQETVRVVATESLAETPPLNFPVTLKAPDNRSAIQRFFSKIRRIF
jgi:hypothetical protein